MYKFALKVLLEGGYPEKSAEATAYALLEADKRGIFSHGIAGGTGLEESVKRAGITATVDPTAELEIEDKKYPTLAVINAHGAPGHISSMKAVEYSLREGIPYSEGQINTLRRAAEHVNLNFGTMLHTLGKKEFPNHIFNK